MCCVINVKVMMCPPVLVKATMMFWPFIDSWGIGFYSDVNLTKECLINSWQVWGCLGHYLSCN